jgi:hypothetical protein
MVKSHLLSSKLERFNRLKKIAKTIPKEKLEETSTTTGVLYVGHLPYGLDDDNLKRYFK